MWTRRAYPLSRINIAAVPQSPDLSHIFTTTTKLAHEPVASWAAYADPLVESARWSVYVDAPVVDYVYIGVAIPDLFLNSPLVTAAPTNNLVYDYATHKLVITTDDTESTFDIDDGTPCPVVVVLNPCAIVMASKIYWQQT